MTERLPPPTHLDPEYLYKKYELLRMSVFKKYRDKMYNQSDREDLLSTIGMIFLQLVNEYDPHRGVDFPYYIKRMLHLRTRHYVLKHLKNVNRETYSEEELVVEDNSYEELFQRIIDLNSLDVDIQLGDKHRQLMVGIIIEHKSLKELAQREGVPPNRIHARLYFLLKKLRKVYEEHVEKYGEDLY